MFDVMSNSTSVEENPFSAIVIWLSQYLGIFANIGQHEFRDYHFKCLPIEMLRCPVPTILAGEGARRCRFLGMKTDGRL